MPDVKNVKSWIHVVAIIVGYSIIQIVVSYKSENALISIAALGILAFLGFYIIKKDSGGNTNYVLGIMEGLKGFLTEKEWQRDKTEDNAHHNFLDNVCKEIQFRIADYKRIYDKLKK
jgi:hypothetical protein